MPSHLKRNSIGAFMIGLIIGIFAVIGSCIENDDEHPAPLPSDGAQFRQWVCDEYDMAFDVGC